MLVTREMPLEPQTQGWALQASREAGLGRFLIAQAPLILCFLMAMWLSSVTRKMRAFPRGL